MAALAEGYIITNSNKYIIEFIIIQLHVYKILFKNSTGQSPWPSLCLTYSIICLLNIIII
jgi:hypothetical protein